MRRSIRMSLNILGSMALDSVETPYGREVDSLGGSASFSALAASLFCDVRMIGIVGTDFPKENMKIFEERGVDTSAVEVKDGATFRWRARYKHELGHAHTIGTEFGVFEGYLPDRNSIRNGESLLLANLDPDIQNWLLEGEAQPGFVACDTMGLWIKEKKSSVLKLLRRADLLLINDAEARLISGERDLIGAARYLRSKGVNMVVIKKGEHGALFFTDRIHSMIPAFLLENIKDPTGAGDTFAGGMIGYLERAKGNINDMLLRRALVYGSIMASFAVEQFSVKGLLQADAKAVKGRYKRFLELTGF